MAKTHIHHTESTLKHFSRHSTACNFAKAEGCNYSARPIPPENGKPNYNGVPGFARQNHHIIPTGCLNRFETWKAYDGYVDVIHSVYCVTEWCSSANANMIALSNDIDAARAAKLPKHNLNHWCVGGYNDEIITDLHMKVWIKAKEVKDDPNCTQAKANEIKSVIESMEQEYRGKLHTRGDDVSASMADRVLSKDELLANLKKSKTHFANDKLNSIGDLWGTGR